jgi:hypothetical protein
MGYKKDVMKTAKWVRMDEDQWGFPKTKDVIHFEPIETLKASGRKAQGYASQSFGVWQVKGYKIYKNMGKRAMKIVKTKKEAIEFIRGYIKRFPKGFK